MSVQVQHTQMIDRPIEAVFKFFAIDHVRNHPRWDSDIELEQISVGPIGIGTLIRRRNHRSGIPVDGTMEVVEYVINQVIAMVVHDGSVEMHGRTTFSAISDHQTSLTTTIDLPGMDESMDKSFLLHRLDVVGKIRKQLMEAEIPESTAG
ncbi:MAG: hypothetical protein ACM3H7_05345 [Acidobacteriaceae bacterium]